MLLGSRIVGEVVGVSGLVYTAYGIEGTVNLLVDEVKDNRNGLVVVFVALRAIANLACT